MLRMIFIGLILSLTFGTAEAAQAKKKKKKKAKEVPADVEDPTQEVEPLAAESSPVSAEPPLAFQGAIGPNTAIKASQFYRVNHLFIFLGANQIDAKGPTKSDSIDIKTTSKQTTAPQIFVLKTLPVVGLRLGASYGRKKQEDISKGDFKAATPASPARSISTTTKTDDTLTTLYLTAPILQVVSLGLEHERVHSKLTRDDAEPADLSYTSFNSSVSLLLKKTEITLSHVPPINVHDQDTGRRRERPTSLVLSAIQRMSRQWSGGLALTRTNHGSTDEEGKVAWDEALHMTHWDNQGGFIEATLTHISNADERDSSGSSYFLQTSVMKAFAKSVFLQGDFGYLTGSGRDDDAKYSLSGTFISLGLAIKY